MNTPLPSRFRFPLLAAGLSLVLALVAGALLLADMRGNVSRFYLAEQDAPVLALGLVLVLGCYWRLRALPARIAWSGRVVALLGILAAALAFAGHWLVLWGHDSSRDEQMASFDAEVFASGRLFAPLPQLWHGHAEALNTLFMLEIPRSQAWISAYLPMNAAIRAGIATLFGTPWLTGPLLLLVGLGALWSCARTLWPEQRESAVIASLLYLGSAQVLVSAMSSYATTAHLALNLVWLALFLRRTLANDLGCLAVGFVAVGLHQPLFHPLFALPLLILVVLERDWKRAMLFLAGYAVIGAFWFAWPQWMTLLAGGGHAAPLAGDNGYLERLLDTLVKGSPNRFQLMTANLLRFFAWMPLLLPVLLVAGLVTGWRNRLVVALSAGVVLIVTIMLVILPYQGHGFGYRYLHGLIGNAILIAVFGYNALVAQSAGWRDLAVRTIAAGVLVILPLQLWMSNLNYAPQALVSRAISARPVDYFVVGIWDAPFSIDLVYNPPNLDRRPIRLFADELTPETIAAICTDGATVGLADEALVAPIIAYSGSFGRDIAARNRVLGERLSAAGCRLEGE